MAHEGAFARTMALTAKALNARDWALSSGTGAGWRLVMDLRRRRALESLRQARAALRWAPAEVRARGYGRALDFLIRLGGKVAERILTEPAMDYWLHLRGTHFTGPRPEREWRLHYGLAGGMAAAAAWAARARGRFETTVPPGGRITLFGSPFVLALPPADEFSPALLRVDMDALELELDGRPCGRWTRGDLAQARPGEPISRGRAQLERLVEAAPGLVVDDSSWLTNHGVTMHGISNLDAGAQERFGAVIGRALEGMKTMAPGLRDEMLDLTRLLVPLKPHETMSSVSSSYMNMRGTICLSYSDSEMLQAETLIHEFCHQKMNQLLEVDPILEPGQSGQVFYSPWRPDARRLRGLLLGAHAFLNVASHLLDAVSSGSYRRRKLVDVMLNVALRAIQVEEGLRTVDQYCDLTPFGLEFVSAMKKELARVHHGCLWFPEPLLREARKTAAAHRAKHALGSTGLYRDARFSDRVRRAPFLSPGGAELQAL